jgi:hypothetical protein
LCNSAGSLGVGNGHLIHRRRTDSHPVGRWFGSVGNQLNPGAPDARLALQAARDWAADCYLVYQEITRIRLINIVIVLIVVGVALWLINNYIPMASSIKMILNIVVVVAVGVWVLQVTGLWGPISSYRVSR